MAYPTNPIYKFYKHPMTGDNAGIWLSKDGKHKGSRCNPRLDRGLSTGFRVGWI